MEREGWTIGAMLWAVALLAPGLAAVSVPGDSGGVFAVATGGALVWVVAFALDEPGATALERGRSVVVGVLASGLALETFGALAALADGQREQAAWFLAAMLYGSIGLAGNLKQAPGDGPLAGQVAFHALMAAPAGAMLLEAVGRSVLFGSPARFWSGLTPFAGRTMAVVAPIGLPLLCGLLATILAVEAHRPVSVRGRLWPALVAGQAAFTIIALRWASDGL